MTTNKPMAWVTADTVGGQTVNGKPRRIWWENNEGVGMPIYAAPQPAVQGEPVAYLFRDEVGRTKIVLRKETAECWCPPGESITPLYAAPQSAEQQPTCTYACTVPDDCETLHWRGQILSLNELASVTQPVVDEEIHVNIEGGDVLTLPLASSGMSAPRFVVHVPAQQPVEQQPMSDVDVLMRLSDYVALQAAYEEELFCVRQDRDTHFGELIRALEQVAALQSECEKLRAAMIEAKSYIDHYMYGGSIYREPAAEAIAIIDAAMEGDTNEGS